MEDKSTYYPPIKLISQILTRFTKPIKGIGGLVNNL